MKSYAPLTEQEQKVLKEIELDADLPLTEVAKHTDLPPHVVRYAIERMKSRGAIRRYPFINIHSLGYSIYHVYCTTRLDKAQTFHSMLEALTRSPCVTWLAELGGKHQLCINFIARNIREVLTFFENLSKSYPDVIQERAISQQASFSLYPGKFLLGEGSTIDSISWQATTTNFTLDERDLLILEALQQQPEISIRDLARKLGEPHSTVASRLIKLKKQGILVGFVYLRDTQVLGTHEYKVLISLRGHDSAKRKEFIEFCRTHPNIITLIEVVGFGDYEVGLEHMRPAEVTAVVNYIKERFAGLISSAEVVPLFKELKVACYPLRILGTQKVNLSKPS